MSGHCPAYQAGTRVRYCRTRSMPHLYAPVTASTQSTWHFGPSETTYWSVTAGTVRDMPWLRLTLTG